MKAAEEGYGSVLISLLESNTNIDVNYQSEVRCVYVPALNECDMRSESCTSVVMAILHVHN